MVRRKVFPEEIIFLRKLGFLNTEIADMTPISYQTVGAICARAIREGILPRRKHAFYDSAWLASKNRFKKLREENVKNIGEILKANGPTEFNELSLMVGISSRRLGKIVQKNRGLLLKIEFNLKQQPGGYKYKTHEKLFSPDFSNYRKNFIALRENRTALVRFFIKALINPESPPIQNIQTRFLKRYLSDAERIAVLWALGVRKWSESQVKSSIQVDGVITHQRKRRPWQIGWQEGKGRRGASK